MIILTILTLTALAFLAWRNFSVALAVTVASAPLYLVRFRLGDLPTTLLELMILVLFWAWLLRWSSNWPNLKQRLSPLKNFIWPIGLFLLASVISTIIAPDHRVALGQLRAFFIEPVIVLFMMITEIRDQHHVRYFARAIGVSVLALALVALYQTLTGWQIPDPWQIIGNRRVVSIYEYPNALALYLGPYLILLLAWRQMARSSLEKLILTCSILFGSLALVFTQSWGGVLGVVAGIFGLMWTHRFWTKRLVIGLIIVASLLFFTQRRLVLAKISSTNIRLGIWSGAARLLAQNPVLGLGLGGFQAKFDSVRPVGYSESIVYPHNIILNFWLELGLLGLISLFWLLIWFFKLDNSAGLTSAAKLAMIAILVHGLVDVPYLKNDLAVQFWVLIGLAIVSIKNAETATQPRLSPAHPHF